jgi:hypothetical protein
VKLQNAQVAGVTAPVFATYEQRVRGNTHMMMMDMNNLQVADWILSWVEKNVGKKPLAVSKR